MQHTTPSGTTPGSTGSAIQCTSTENFVALPLLERNSEVFAERVTAITKLGLLVVQPGRGTRQSLCAVTDDFNHLHKPFLTGWILFKLLLPNYVEMTITVEVEVEALDQFWNFLGNCT